MASLPLIFISALLATALGLHQGPSPVARIVSHDGLHRLMQHTSLRMSKVQSSPICDHMVQGEYKIFGTEVSYDGSFRGKESPSGISFDFDYNFRGMYRMMGWDGKFDGDARGKYSVEIDGKKFFVRMNAKSTSRFYGKIEGADATVDAVSTINVIASSTDKISITETGRFSAVVAGKKATGTFRTEVRDSSFFSVMKGMYAAKKFKFEFRGSIDGLFDLFRIDNSGSYKTICAGAKPITGTFNQQAFAMVE